MESVSVRPAGERPSGLQAFLFEAMAGVFRREALIPILLLLVLLTATNIVLAQNLPIEGQPPPRPFLLAGLFRLAGLMILAVAILRIAGGSDRPKWRFDGAFWLYQLIAPLGLGVMALMALVFGGHETPLSRLLAIAAAAVVMAPFAAWLAAIAAARPLAWNPLHWMRDFGYWLPQLLSWWLLIVVPMAFAHATIDLWLVRGAPGDWFWPVALFDGALTTVMALIGLGLQAAAYRRVARH